MKYSALPARLAALAVLAISSTAFAVENGHPLILWRVAGAENTVYLLGTIHALRKSDYPLPAAIDLAYEQADELVMELDMDALDPIATQALVHDLGMIKDGRSLSDMLGPETYGQASEYAAAINIPLTMLGSAEPWLAAVTVENLLLNRLGFDATLGLEMYLLRKAQEDGKPIAGLETERQQMEILDGLSPDMQEVLLLQALADGAEMEPMLDELINAWRNGAADKLASEMLQELKEYPEILHALVSERNESWRIRVEQLLEHDRDYLVAVGALHLVGDSGLPTLLENSGWAVSQMWQESR